MDDLDYSYEGNLLASVSDGGSASLGLKNLTGSASAYGYDASGNLVTDPKKGIELGYNSRSRPERVTVSAASGRHIDYTYDAGGALLRKAQYDNHVLVKTTDYIGSFVYEDGTLSHFAMAEGRVRNTGSGLKPEYMLTDHQGNVRVSFEEQGGQAVVRQENSYYPYGLVMPGGSFPTQPNRNLYNGGSEWQNDYGDLPDYYRTHYRNYDAALGRFISADPLADASVTLTPYQYAGNEPLLHNDPLGDRKQRTGGGMELLQPFYDNYGTNWGGGGAMDIAERLWESRYGYGGFWDREGGFGYFGSQADAFYYGAYAISEMGGWGRNGWASDYGSAARAFNLSGSGTVSTRSSNYYTVGYYYRSNQGNPETRNGVSGAFRAFYAGKSGGAANSGSGSFFGDALTFTDKHFNGGLGTVGVAVQGYNNIPNDIKRTYAYKLSKMTGVKSGQIFQGAKSFANSTGKLVSKLGPVGTLLGVGVAGYEIGTGTWDAHTAVNIALIGGAAAATIFAAPAVLTGIAIYGVGDYFFDFGGTIDKTVGRNSGVWGP